MVPLAIRSNIWALYRRGQEIDKKPSKEYLLEMRRAIAVVAEKEGK